MKYVYIIEIYAMSNFPDFEGVYSSLEEARQHPLDIEKSWRVGIVRLPFGRRFGDGDIEHYRIPGHLPSDSVIANEEFRKTGHVTHQPSDPESP